MRTFLVGLVFVAVPLLSASVFAGTASTPAVSASSAAGAPVDTTQVPCTGVAPGSCVFVCFAGTHFTVVFVGKGSVSGDCGGASASCSTTDGFCAADSDLVQFLDVGLCSGTGTGDFACLSPSCTVSCIDDGLRTEPVLSDVEGVRPAVLQ